MGKKDKGETKERILAEKKGRKKEKERKKNTPRQPRDAQGTNDAQIKTRYKAKPGQQTPDKIQG